jgi:tetraacyldisaccharide 4'-kinase
MREPAFWGRDGVLPRLLDPLGGIYAAGTARRLRRPGWHAPAPVICCGAATAGGAGKTPLALDLGQRLRARGRRPAFLTRGHRGRLRQAFPVDPARHDAAAVGDEALLLAEVAPTYACADRVAGARAALAAGADVLVMDDGLQNPGLAGKIGLLVVDGGSGFGSGRVIPAGPLREPIGTAAARCRLAVLLGEDRTDARARLPPALPVLSAELRPVAEPALAGARVLAFAGIGRPEKFFASLRAAGAEPVICRAFPDHHAFTPADLRRLSQTASGAGLRLVTTAKDAVRLPEHFRHRVVVLRVTLAWHDDEPAIEAFLGAL